MARKKATAKPYPEPEFLTISATILQETDDAILIECDGQEEWLPISQIDFAGERGDTDVEITLPDWLAEEKGFCDGQGFNNNEIVTPEPQEEVPATDAPGQTSEIQPDNEIEVGEQEGSSTPNDRVYLNSEIVTVIQELTEAEKAECAEEMAKLDGEIEDLEDELDHHRKSFKKQIDAKENERREMAKMVRQGKEEREIFCDKLADYNTCEIVWTDAHSPHAEVKRRKMTEAERQLPLPMSGLTSEEQAGEVKAEAGNPFFSIWGRLEMLTPENISITFTTLAAEEVTLHFKPEEVKHKKHLEIGDSAYFEIPLSAAVDEGLIKDLDSALEAEESAETEENWQVNGTVQSCGNCAHTFAASEEGESPCDTCESEQLNNWQSQDAENIIPASAQEQLPEKAI